MQRKLHARWFALGLMIMLAAVASIVVVPAMGATPEGHWRGEGDFQVVDLAAPSPGRFDLRQEEPQRPDNLADVTDHPKGRSEFQRAVSALDHIAETQDSSIYRANASPPAVPSSLEETCGQFEPFELEAVEGTPATTSRETSKCSVRVQLTKGNDPASGTNTQPNGKVSCRMTFTPTSLPEGGLDVMVTSTGGCTGSHTSIAISGKAARPNAIGPAAKIVSYPRHVQAKIIGNDNIHLPIFWEYQNIDWQYDYVNVYDGTFPRDKWADQYWSVLFQTSGSSWSNSPAPHYEAYNYVHFHSDGFPASAFPNVDFWGQPTAYGYYNGDYGCTYWVLEGDGWESYTPPGGPGLHWHAICYPW